MTDRISDEALDYWGDAFMGANLADRMTFEQFLALPPARREAQIGAQLIQERLEAQLDSRRSCCELRGGGLIEPLHHAPASRNRREDRPVSLYLRRAEK